MYSATPHDGLGALDCARRSRMRRHGPAHAFQRWPGQRQGGGEVSSFRQERYGNLLNLSFRC